ncbi:hypothetical protein Pse7367_0312 [Thalassoporum mexicanum PCC 7367]|uniref:DUF6629 family protein n=1 Tax=Thalassoporum mexicanum TaxID=3457544 RepID=UPI00029FA876|nr:DUF6629 family protein [Pseudanabaena sp. PCC 7367]AFY68625.1 hypothetical protein Pse7367_0312 [Pseudanabaena sp. PCC 7367]
MCFSVEASFAASGVLIPVGIYCIRSAIQSDRAFVTIAGWPLLFGIQQGCEGLLWLGIGNLDANLIQPAALGFLFFSHWLWLFWTPFSALALEPKQKLRSLLLAFTIAGFLYGGLLYLPLLFDQSSLMLEIANGSIHYATEYIFNPYVPKDFSFWVYGAIILLPLFISSRPNINWLGGLIFVAAIGTYLLYSYAFISVWCFFAAIVSIYLVFAIRQEVGLGAEATL